MNFRTHTARVLRPALLGTAALCLLLACVTRRTSDVAVHEWWNERGPVIPHDTFPLDCQRCHEGDTWNQIRDDFEFDHLAETGLELLGAHAEAECLRCHNDRGPAQSFANRGCVGCHEDVHRGQSGKNCESCHAETERDWRVKEAVALHDRTRFPLVGAHAAAACWRCHPAAQIGDFARADTECLTCHRDDLARATDPDHAAQGFVDNCDRCHIPTTWDGAGFNHSIFPLTGAHATAACESCHAGGLFAGTPNQCVDCHLTDYNGARDPNHVTGNFPTACDQCHNTAAWEGAVFNHSPVNGGNHSGLDCLDCHTNPGNFRVFACIDCHEHNQRDTDDEHDGDRIRGYVYESNACFACHPNGR